MIQLLQSIVEVVTSVVSFVIHSITSLFNLLSHIPQYVSFMATSINVLPSVIIPFALASVSVYVVFLVLGRN